MRVRQLLVPIYLCVSLCICTESAFSAADLQISRITPTGVDVPVGNQLVIQFNRDVVPLGNMQRSAAEIPINIKPQLACHWRWLTASTLACQLADEEKLNFATEYILEVSPGALNKLGEGLATTHRHNFSTRRPAIENAYFDSQDRIGQPLTRMVFNQAVTRRSVAKSIKYQFTADGKTKYVGSRVSSFTPYGEAEVDATSTRRKVSESRHWLVQPRTALPAATSIKLIALPGLVSAEGDLKSEKSRTIEKFDTLGDFSFVGFSCVDEHNETIYSHLVNGSILACKAERSISLSFSAPPDKASLSGILSLSQDGTLTDTMATSWQGEQHSPTMYRYHRFGTVYSIYLPIRLAPNASFVLETLADMARGDGLKKPVDVFGRELNNKINFSFSTLHYDPRYSLPYEVAVLEQNIASDVPIVLTNIDAIHVDYSTSHGKSDSITIEPEFVKNETLIIPLGVRELLGEDSGLLSAYLTSSPRVSADDHPEHVIAQITPFQVHAKMGHFSSLVWVSDMATGELIKDAKIEVLQADDAIATSSVKLLDSGTTDVNGIANLKGLSVLDPKQEIRNWCRKPKECPQMFVRVTSQGHSALLPLRYAYEMYVGSFSTYTVHRRAVAKYGHMIAWGMTAQGLYRRGQTMQYKLYLRNQNNTSLTAAPKGNYKLEVRDASDKVVHTQSDVQLNDYGSLSGEFKLAETAMMGWYSFELTSDFDDRGWSVMQVLVTDFNPSAFRLSQQLNGELFAAGQALVVDADARLHSGGPYSGSEATIEVSARPWVFTSSHTIAKDFVFSNYQEARNKLLLEKKVALDRKGRAEAEISLPVLEEALQTAELQVQTTVRDDRGKPIVSRSKAHYLAFDRLVGLYSPKWLYQSGMPATLKYLVVDRQGQPIAGTPVSILIEQRQTKIAKAKSAGNAYLPRYVEEWIEVADCAGVSKSDAGDCSFTPDAAGTYRFTASVDDTQGRTQSVKQQIWVAGEGYVSWHQDNTNALTLVPEKEQYSVGDKARFLVKNPYPGAEALITIERYGILKSWQQSLSGSTPVIEFDIEPEYLPGAYLSVLVTVPRVAAEVPEIGQVDLGKPTYKMGYQKLSISDPYKAIDFTFNTDAETYKPGQIVELTIKPQVRNPIADEGIELAVTVLDEAVLDLIKGGVDYFDPARGFNQLEPLDVGNYNLLTRLIGLQKFSKKGANSGGGGGGLEIRDNMKGVAFFADSIQIKDYLVANSSQEEVVVTEMSPGSSVVAAQEENKPDAPRDDMEDLAHWQDRTTVNKDGSVTIQFKLPDNLTAWRVLAIATTPSDRMGLGQHSFKVNKLTEIRPVLPNQVREGDQFKAGFSVHNRSEEQRSIKVSIEADGDTSSREVLTETVQLEAHARDTVFLPTIANRLESGTKKGAINYLVRAEDALDGDALRQTIAVTKKASLETATMYGRISGERKVQRIEVPANIDADVGGISVLMSPTIISNVDSAFQYMRDYPYTCWEQKLSKGVMAAHFQTLSPYISATTRWPESEELVQSTLDEAISFQAANGGMAYFQANDAHVSPYLSAYTGLAFSWLSKAGYQVPENVQKNLHEYLKELLRKEHFPQYFSQGMIDTVRAVALAALANSGDLAFADLERHLAKSGTMSLFGKAQLLAALQQFDGTDVEQKRLLDEMFAYSNDTSAKISFNEDRSDAYARILHSSTRTNCAILDALSSSRADIIDPLLVSRLARQVVSDRGVNLHWQNTQDNTFCLNALASYAATYETETPKLTATVSIDDSLLGEAQFSDFSDTAVSLVQAMRPELVGKSKEMTIDREGHGQAYYQASLQFSPLKRSLERQNAGMDIRREQSVFRGKRWHLLKDGDDIQRGDVIRTDLFLSVPSPRNFVVVHDPVAGGLEPVNTELATSGGLMSLEFANRPAKDSYWYKHQDWQGMSFSPWGFYHQELGHDAATFYADHLSKGRYHLSYMANAIAAGEFVVLPVHAEEMYQPDIYGKGVGGRLRIVER